MKPARSMTYSTDHPRIRAAGLLLPVRRILPASRRAAEGPVRADPDRLPRWG